MTRRIIGLTFVITMFIQLTSLQAQSSVRQLSVNGHNVSFSEYGDSLIYKRLGDKTSRTTALKDLGIEMYEAFEFRSPVLTKVYASDNLRHIVVNTNGKKKRLQPLGEEDYINISLSPKGDQILFRATGEGSFVCDLEGNIVHELVNAEFPLWYSDHEIVYAIVEDDGYEYTSSRLIFHDLNTGHSSDLVNAEDIIPIFPDLDLRRKNLIFNTPDRRVYFLDMNK